MQIERLQKAADDAKQQLDSKENIVKELSRDGSKLDKERYILLSPPGNQVLCFHRLSIGSFQEQTLVSCCATLIAQYLKPTSDLLSCLAVVLSVFLATITKLDKLMTEPVLPACWVILLTSGAEGPMQTCNAFLRRIERILGDRQQFAKACHDFAVCGPCHERLTQSNTTLRCLKHDSAWAEATSCRCHMPALRCTWSTDSLFICLCYSGGRVRLMPRQGMHGCRERWKRWSALKLCCRSSELLIEITRM